MEMQHILPESTTIMPVGEHLFDEAMHVTRITEFGISFEDVAGGRVALPPQGVRFEVAYEGAVEGAKLKGFINGVDYIHVSADGRFHLNIFATLTTDDDEKIVVTSSGILKAPDPATGHAPVRLNMTFSTVAPQYTWVNALQAWGTGTVNLHSREINVQIYAA